MKGTNSYATEWVASILVQKKADNLNVICFSIYAEAGGFEPPERLPVRQFSKLVV